MCSLSLSWKLPVNKFSDVYSQFFDSESELRENVFETEYNVEEDPDCEASSSDEMCF